jgi:hypothetical protein
MSACVECQRLQSALQNASVDARDAKAEGPPTESLVVSITAQKLAKAYGEYTAHLELHEHEELDAQTKDYSCQDEFQERF